VNTIIQTRIDGETWQATTPHSPDMIATNASESLAVNDLCAQIRALPSPVAWIETPKTHPDDGAITRNITGLWPVDIQETHQREENEDGN